MKTLFLLRHAKAENPAPGSGDFDRTLNERGKREARAVGVFIKKLDLEFDLVLCSAAVRACETAELALVAAESQASMRFDQRLYEAAPQRLLEVIAEVEEDRNTVLLVGHNPGMEQLLQLLTDRVEQMGTCTLAKADLQADQWSKVRDSACNLDWIVKPKELNAC